MDLITLLTTLEPGWSNMNWTMILTECLSLIGRSSELLIIWNIIVQSVFHFILRCNKLPMFRWKLTEHGGVYESVYRPCANRIISKGHKPLKHFRQSNIHTPHDEITPCRTIEIILANHSKVRMAFERSSIKRYFSNLQFIYLCSGIWYDYMVAPLVW